MKNEPRNTGPAEQEADTPASEETQEGDLKGRNGEGARSAMKHWLHEERNRTKRPEH
jgi:hypothetical protein